MGKLTNLLKWRKSIIIKDDRGLVKRDENGNPVTVYMRIIGDKDLEEAMLKARYASAMKRAVLLIEESEDYVANVAVFNNATREQCIEMIVQGRGANWAGEAFSVVTIPDLPKIEEIASDPDAPTLEELEKLDKSIDKIDQDYREEVAAFISSREISLRSELEDKPLEELIELAKKEVIVVSSVATYLDTLRDEKIWRSVYQDEHYTLHEFKDIEEYQNLNAVIKEQLRAEYEALEAGLGDVKN